MQIVRNRYNARPCVLGSLLGNMLAFEVDRAMGRGYTREGRCPCSTSPFGSALERKGTCAVPATDISSSDVAAGAVVALSLHRGFAEGYVGTEEPNGVQTGCLSDRTVWLA